MIARTKIESKASSLDCTQNQGEERKKASRTIEK
jgi:hypothetical protein